jgi:hypothetical protein
MLHRTQEIREVRQRGASLALAMTLMLAACGGASPGEKESEPAAPTGPGGSGGGTSEGSQAELESTARAAFEAVLAEDDQAYFNLLATDCRESVGFALVSGHLQSRRFTARVNNVDYADLSIAEVNVSDFTGTTANVALAIDGPSGDQFWETQSLPWIHEDDGWRYASCAEFASGGGNSGGDQGLSADNPLPVGLLGEPADWLVVTTYVSPDFTDLVLEEPGNAAPADGNVYFGVQMSFSYDGPKASTAFSEDLGFRLEAGGKTYDGANACGHYAQEPELDFTAGPGDSSLFTLCWEIPTGAVDSATIVVTDLTSGTDWWFTTSE